MTLLKSFFVTSTLILSGALALAQADGSIGRPGDGHGGPPGSIDRPDDHNNPPDDRYPGDRNPGDRYPGDRNPGRDRDNYRGRQTIHCKSSGYRYNTCPVGDNILQVNLLRRQSHSACNEGYSWGFSRDVIWVDHGCEADFDVITGSAGGGRPGRPGHGRPPGPGRPGPRPPNHEEQVINCDSSGYNYNQCFVGGYGQIIDVQLMRQNSRSACDYGYSWGFDADSVWVDRGCRATFRVFKDTRR